MTRSAQITLGITIAIVGLVSFLHRDYFAQHFLGADSPPYDLFQSQNDVSASEMKRQDVAIVGGTLFFVGVVITFGAASRRKT